jgi:hypothetical protein
MNNGQTPTSNAFSLTFLKCLLDKILNSTPDSLHPHEDEPESFLKYDDGDNQLIPSANLIHAITMAKHLLAMLTKSVYIVAYTAMVSPVVTAFEINRTAISRLSHETRNTRHLQKKFFGDHEQMMRVQDTPHEVDVDPRSTYNEKFMALMNSPCRPEKDGIFGATSGEPFKIQYGLQLEIEPLSDIMTVLDAIEDLIVDSILMKTFPEMCGLRRRAQQSTSHVAKNNNRIEESRNLAHEDEHPSGFRFEKFQEVGKLRTGSSYDTLHSAHY